VDPPPRDRGRQGGAEGLRTVAVALAANVGIATAKLIAALLTRSSALWAEMFHSAADTGNQVLLLIANRRAGRPPEPGYPLGHGREAYFWALIASLGMFFTGALLSIREGVGQLLHPEPIRSLTVAYVTLGVSFCLDGISLIRAAVQLRREARTLEREFLEHLDLTSDPVARAVFAEDSVAVVGNFVAAAGILLHQSTGSAIPDAVAALVIGLCLAIVALDLARRNRDFLIGLEAPPAVRRRLTDLIARQRGVARVGQLLVTYVGPRRLWVVARIDVEGGAGRRRAGRAGDRGRAQREGRGAGRGPGRRRAARRPSRRRLSVLATAARASAGPGARSRSGGRCRSVGS
jgi:cation diffusion facilitator family transporter